MNELKFIKAEFQGGGSYPFKYYWECSMCGETYTTVLPSNTNGLCEDCKNKVCQRERKERKKKIEKEKYIKLSVLNEIMEYTKGMLTAEKYGLQHKIQSMIDDIETDKKDISERSEDYGSNDRD
jgi:hypothetical protein